MEVLLSGLRGVVDRLYESISKSPSTSCSRFAVPIESRFYNPVSRYLASVVALRLPDH